jgi:hypothetical protein
MKRTLGRFLATVIVCAILLYFIWWIVGALAVVVLVEVGVKVGVKVWQWSTAIRPPKPGGSRRSKPALIAASVGVPAAGACDIARPVSGRAAEGDRQGSAPAAAATIP